MDSYAYLAYPSYGQQNKYAKRNTLVLPYVERFNADTIDTFLFHWSDSQHYLFVRVLESTVAIKPANPRIASLYFNYTSIPQPPTTKTRRSSTQKLQSLIKNFMHIDSDVDSSDSSSNSVKSTDTVTLNDVLSQTPDEDWIHAPCHVTYDKGDFDDHLELHSTQHTLHLTARCYKEKMMFINLLHLTHQWAPPPPPLMPPPISMDDLFKAVCTNITTLMAKIDKQKERIQRSTEEIIQTKKAFTTLHLSPRIQDELIHTSFQPMIRYELRMITKQLRKVCAGINHENKVVVNINRRIAKHEMLLERDVHRCKAMKKQIDYSAWTFEFVKVFIPSFIVFVSILYFIPSQ